MSSNPLRLKFLLKKYVENNCTPPELEEFWQLMSTLSENDLILLDIKELWHKCDQMKEEDENYWKQIYGRLDQRIKTIHQDNRPVLAKRVRRVKMIGLAAAACLFICMLFAGWFIQQNNKPGKSITQKVDKVPGHQVITLPDGTTVTLNSGSKLEYPATFHGSTRNVYLIGEAYFDVKHDAHKPFLVHSGSYVVKVLGTSFNIKAYLGETDMEVTVTTGKVQVQNTKRRKDLAILMPGQKLLIHKIKGSADIVTADIPKTLEWKSEDMIFDNITFDEAAIIISNRYGIGLRFTNDSLRDCRFTCKFSNNTSYEDILDIICVLTNSNWKRETGSVILLNGKGCE